jgi:hypothetical protein
MVGSAVATTVASSPIMNPASEPVISVTCARRGLSLAARVCWAWLVVRRAISSSSMR